MIKDKAFAIIGFSAAYAVFGYFFPGHSSFAQAITVLGSFGMAVRIVIEVNSSDDV